MKPQRADFSPLAAAIQWTSRITSISLELVVPALVGVWLDRRLGTGLLFVMLGVVLGFIVATISLVQLAKSSDQRRQKR